MMMDNRDRLRILNTMGIDVWVPRPPEPETRSRHVGAEQEPGSDIDPGRWTWPELEQAANACTRCELHRTRTRVVFGCGDREADWMIIGEAPGANEDRQGEPFVGRAGQLLDAMLSAIGVSRDSVYIANTLKCRPPGNRDPEPQETRQCSDFLAGQIALLQPKVIVAVGRIAANTLLESDEALGRMRGRVYSLPGAHAVPVVVTYHPAYLLRSPDQKPKVWADLKLARDQVTRAPANTGSFH